MPACTVPHAEWSSHDCGGAPRLLHVPRRRHLVREVEHAVGRKDDRPRAGALRQGERGAVVGDFLREALDFEGVGRRYCEGAELPQSLDSGDCLIADEVVRVPGMQRQRLMRAEAILNRGRLDVTEPLYRLVTALSSPDTMITGTPTLPN